MNQNNLLAWASGAIDATGLSWPALIVLLAIALAAVLGVAYAYRNRRRR